MQMISANHTGKYEFFVAPATYKQNIFSFLGNTGNSHFLKRKRVIKGLTWNGKSPDLVLTSGNRSEPVTLNLLRVTSE